MKKTGIYLGISVFVFIFGQIYEYFSHGVYSNYMIFAFLIPFAGLFILWILNNLIFKIEISYFVLLPWKCGTATLTAGSLYKGILEIYGTSTTFEIFYLITGIAFCILAAFIMATGKGKVNKDCELNF